MAGLEDLLLFDARVYWRLFALENAAVWPAQPVVLAAALLLILCLLLGLAAVRPLARAGARARPGCGAAGTSWHSATGR